MPPTQSTDRPLRAPRRPPAARRTRAPGRERRLATYEADGALQREIVERPGARGSRLVLDRDARDGGDARLLAHLAADEPARNAELVCALYLDGNPPAGPRCRRLLPDDLRCAPFDVRSSPRFAVGSEAPLECRVGGLAYSIGRVEGRGRRPELRWQRIGADVVTVSLRDVVGAIEDYEPACGQTARAIRAYAGSGVSTGVLGVELGRVQGSAIVLNRRLREVVLAALARDELSMSEVATRCGRTKRDSRGRCSGETSWLARRLGLLAEGGQQAPTPWIHSDVLALIARRGLGVSPREVEV